MILEPKTNVVNNGEHVGLMGYFTRTLRMAAWLQVKVGVRRLAVFDDGSAKQINCDTVGINEPYRACGNHFSTGGQGQKITI